MNFLLKGFRNIIHVLSRYGLKVAVKALRNYRAAYLRKLQLSLPVEIQIEPSSACNLHCRMCGLDKSTQKAFLTPEQFGLILDRLGTTKGINLTGMGEGLLNGDLEKLINMAGQRGIDVGFVTNGLLLTEGRINSLLSTSLKNVSISIESAVPGGYEQIRRGGALKKLIANLEQLSNAAKFSRPDLLIYLNTVLIKEVLDDFNNIRSVIDLAASISSIRGITVQNVHDIFSSNTSSHYDSPECSINQFFHQIRSYAAAKNVEINLPQAFIMKSSCYYPWVYPYITVFGDVLPCCVLPQFGPYNEIISEFSFGNIFTDDIDKIWNGSRAMAFRKQLVEDPIPYCKRCSKYLNIL